MADIVSELRVQQERQIGPSGNATYLSDMMGAAADTIERLTAEVEALRAMLTQAEHDIVHDHQAEMAADYQAHMAFLRNSQ